MAKLNVKDKSFLHQKLAENGYSMKSLSQHLCVSSCYLSLVINQKKNPSAPLAKRIAESLKVEISDIFFIN